jgi:Ca2+-transporting ATPase
MDLAASATFVAERSESDLMHQPPRDPKAPFMNRGMVSSIFGSAIGLFAAVSILYLLAWYSGAGLERAQTIAFVTWLVGHIFLAFNLRSDREPLLRLGAFSNRVMVGWAGATAAFILVVTLVPWIQGILKTVPLTGFEWLLILTVTFLGTFWIEASKWLVPRITSTR